MVAMVMAAAMVEVAMVEAAMVEAAMVEAETMAAARRRPQPSEWIRSRGLRPAGIGW